jgi:hypothetical protein
MTKYPSVIIIHVIANERSYASDALGAHAGVSNLRG